MLIVHGQGRQEIRRRRRRTLKEGRGQKAIPLLLGPNTTKAQRSPGSQERWSVANELIRTSSALPDQYRLV